MTASGIDASRAALLAAARTPAIAVVERSLRAGEMSPLHAHVDDEAYHVVEGALTLWVGTTEVVLGAGDSYVVPRGAPHTHRAETARCRFRTTTVVVSAARYDDFTRAAAIPSNRGMTADEAASLRAIASVNRIEILGAPGALVA